MEKIELLKVKSKTYEAPKNGCTMGYAEIGEEINFSDSLSIDTLATFGEFECLADIVKSEAALEALKKNHSVSEKLGDSEFLVTEFALVSSQFDSEGYWVRSIALDFADWEF